MAEEEKTTTETQPVKETTVAPKKVAPIEVKLNKGGEKAVAKDPKGMFDYSNCQTHVVKQGETLYDIAQKYVVALQQLRYFNHIDRLTWKITPGQTLYIPNKPIFVPSGK